MAERERERWEDQDDWSEEETPAGRLWHRFRRGRWEQSGTDAEWDDAESVDFVDDADEERSARSWQPIVVGVLLVAAFLVRFSAAEHLSSHIDEGASIMAAHAVAEKGAPVFPSGTLYLQGATLSYILAPVVFAGYGDLDDLNVLRFPSVVAGTLAVLFMFLLGRAISGSPVIGLLSAAALAFDPLSVRWSGHVRMYALLQLCVLGLLWLYFRALLGPPNRRLLIAMVGVFWLSVFTHIATLLFWPGLVLCALIIHGRALRDRRRDLTIALGACLGAPVILLLLNQIFEPTDKAVSQTVPGVSFVGDYFLSISQLVHPNIEPWLLLFRRTPLEGVMPFVIVAVSGLLLGRFFLTPSLPRGLRPRRRIVGLLLILYWLPIGLVTGFTSGAEERYLIHVHPLGFLLCALLIADFVQWLGQRDGIVASSRPSPAYAFAPAGFDAMPGRTRRRFALPLPASRDEEWSDDDWDDTETREKDGEPPPEVIARPLSRTVALAFVGVLVIAGAVLRLVHLDTLSLWLDEGFTVLYSRLPWDSVLGFNGFYSPHPPLFFALVKAVATETGDEYAARLISAVSAIATLPVFYAIAARLLDRRAALVATLTLAISPMNIYYANEARMYALLVFLAALTYLALIAYWQEPDWRWATLYGLAGVLAMYVDYSAVYVLAPQALPLAAIMIRHRKRARSIVLAIVGAGLLYLPWLPTVFDTVSSANEETRREDYLGAQPHRIWNAILSIVGIGGDDSYFYGSEQAPWHRFPGASALLLLAFLPVVVLGILALRRQRRALIVAGCLGVGTVVVAIWISQISPGFAERTVLGATLGWALLIGAAFREGVRRERLLVAAGSFGAVVLASVLTLSAIFGGAEKQEWREASAAVAEAAPWGMPLVTYSYGAVADTLIDVYQPGLLNVMRHVTIRDGELENRLSGGVLREVGLTRADLGAGKLAEALPASDPANGAVWYLYPPRTGEEEVHAAFLSAGYERIYRRLYDHPRYRLWLDLYVRPGTRLGTPLAINGTFADGAAGWTLPATGATVAASADAALGSELTLASESDDGVTATLDVPATDDGLYSASIDVASATPADGGEPRIALSCLDANGTVLDAGETEPTTAGEVDWITIRAAAWCPTGTEQVRLTLSTFGLGKRAFRNATIDALPVIDRGPEG